MEKQSTAARRMLTHAELRLDKSDRKTFLSMPRRPITVVLDGVRRPYNIGAIFRLCDAFLVERLVICGTTIDLNNRKLVQAARGTHRWAPWIAAENAAEIVTAAKASGAWIVAAEQTDVSVTPGTVTRGNSVVLVLGSEANGVSQEVLDMADAVVAIPMLGMANSLNVSTAAAILIYELSQARLPSLGNW